MIIVAITTFGPPPTTISMSHTARCIVNDEAIKTIVKMPDCNTSRCVRRRHDASGREW